MYVFVNRILFVKSNIIFLSYIDSPFIKILKIYCDITILQILQDTTILCIKKMKFCRKCTKKTFEN